MVIARLFLAVISLGAPGQPRDIEGFDRREGVELSPARGFSESVPEYRSEAEIKRRLVGMILWGTGR